jgi:hypothetical protein
MRPFWFSTHAFVGLHADQLGTSHVAGLSLESPVIFVTKLCRLDSET